MTISRRHVLVAALAGPIGVRFATSNVLAQVGTQPKIGDTKSMFDAWFGDGSPVDGFIHYPPLSAGRASYFVKFDENDTAEAVVGNFHDVAGGGISYTYGNVHELGQSQFVPDNAIAGPLGQFGNALHTLGSFGVRSWASSSALNIAGRSNQVVVMDRLELGERMGLQLFKETIVVTDSAARYPIVPTDTHLGPHSSYEAWQQYPGGVSPHQSGLDLRNPQVPGTWTIYGTVSGVSVHLDQPQSVEEAAVLIGSMLPLADLEWSAWIPASPITSWPIRLHQFRAQNTGDRYLTAQFIDGDEETGVVWRFDLTPVDNSGAGIPFAPEADTLSNPAYDVLVGEWGGNRRTATFNADGSGTIQYSLISGGSYIVFHVQADPGSNPATVTIVDITTGGEIDRTQYPSIGDTLVLDLQPTNILYIELEPGWGLRLCSPALPTSDPAACQSW